ncbi:MAG: hypothetical protein IAG13_05410 [Deltaproteobacteria bacterium]|nr:hypothetical protein [Nannocystaceae bacterium]
MVTGCEGAVTDGSDAEFRHGGSQEFTVEFDDCQEFAGLFPVTLADVAAYVPSDYTIATFDGATAFVVFRTAECQGLEFEDDEDDEDDDDDDDDDDATIVSQVGINIVPPFGVGDINNYTLHYGTNNERLARKLKRAGVNARRVRKLDFDFDANANGDGTGEYAIENPDKDFYHLISGPVSDPPLDDPGIPFIANWWRYGLGDNVVMETDIEALFQGDASQVQVTTKANTEVAELLGGTVTAPSVFAIRGIIPHAVMDVGPTDL